MCMYIYINICSSTNMYGKRLIVIKKCRITPWQEKNTNPHSDLKQKINK